jgi:GNAT superfamily N-acetyltransferase
MKGAVEMRPASPQDIVQLLPLVEQYWRFEAIEGFDAARISALLERVMNDSSLGHVWLATAGSLPAGYLLAVYVFSLEHQGLTAEIDEFFVLPAFRGTGLGRGLLRMAEEQFRERGCTSVALQIGRDNEAARAFYRSQGYADRAGFELVDKMLTSA